MGYYYHSRNSGCGCTGCLVLLFIAALILALILFLLSTLLQIVAGLVALILRLVILVLCIFVGLLILIPSLVSFVMIIRNVVFAVRDAIGDNHYYRKPLASLPKRFFSRFWGFTKDYWSYYLKHSVSTIKDCYAKSVNSSLRVFMRAWNFLLMVASAFFIFVAPVLLVVMLIFHGIFMGRLIPALIAKVGEFFRNLLLIQ